MTKINLCSPSYYFIWLKQFMKPQPLVLQLMHPCRFLFMHDT